MTQISASHVTSPFPPRATRFQAFYPLLSGSQLWDSPLTDVATLANLLRETAEHHDHYEKTHGEHHWWDWYAPYLNARQNGSSSEDAAAAADRYMEEAFLLLSK